MMQLNLPEYPVRVKSKENKLYIFDRIRKKDILLTDEEWVRQHFIWYLIEEKNYPESLIAVEKQLKLNRTIKRTDLLLFNRQGRPEIIVECKAPHVKIDQTTFDQIARYNMSLAASYLVVTNGIDHYYCKIDQTAERYVFLKDIPAYSKT